MVRDLVRQSAGASADVQDDAAHLEGRLDAVFRVQATIADRLSDGIQLGMLVTEEPLRHAASEGKRLSVAGLEALLAPDIAGVLALAIHELAVDAVEFGALPTSEGRLAVSWTLAAARMTSS